MATITDTLAIAAYHHQAGNLAEAEDIYRQVLESDANHAGALYLLGLMAHQLGRHETAIEYLLHAIAIDGLHAIFYNLLGAAYRAVGRTAEAMAAFRRAVELEPDSAEAYNGLGILHDEQRNGKEAIACYQRAIQLRPDFAEVHHNLGMAWKEQGKLDEAIASYRRAIELKGHYAEAHNHLGIAYAEQGDLSQAMVCFRRALEIKPDFPEAYNNLGIASRDCGDLDAAAACFQQAIDLQPSATAALSNLGLARRDQGQFDEAIAWFERALEQRPDDAEAHTGRASIWLLRGDFARGWPEYEWRGRARRSDVDDRRGRPWWDGGPLHGRTILLRCEQGLGDTIQFIRYAPLVKQQGGTVVVECQESLLPLLTSCRGIDRLVAQGAGLPAFDVHALLLSLPNLFKTRVDTIPADVPYLSADPARIEAWRARLARIPGFKVGINWQGNPKVRADRLRSIPLVEFAPLADVPGVSLLSVQKGHGAEQLTALDERFPVACVGEFDEYSAMDRAAILVNLDLLITSDTAMAHLAGALGVPVWVAVPFAPDWRWLLDREDSPWYPTMRLFRQTAPGDWGGVFRRIQAALSERLGRP